MEHKKVYHTCDCCGEVIERYGAVNWSCTVRASVRIDNSFDSIDVDWIDLCSTCLPIVKKLAGS